MAVERFEVELDAKIDKFKSKMKEAGTITKGLGKKVKDLNFGWETSSGQINTWGRLASQLRDASREGGKLSNQFTLMKPAVKETTEQVEDLNSETKNVSNSAKITGNSLDKAFSKGLKSVKKLTLGFLGARSAFMLFRKYLGEYQSQNEDFANKMQLTTNVLVNSLAPAFEFFGNVVQYAVIGLARIIELLTGVNILAKTVDNGFKDASKSAKEFNDNLSGLDEISNISEDSGGLSTGIGSQLNALNEFQKKIAEVDKWLEKTGIRKFFEDIGKTLGTLWNAFNNQPNWLKWFEVGIGTVGLLLGKAGGTTGLFGIALVLGTIAAINVAEIVDAWGDLIDKTKQNEKTADDLIKKWQNLQEESDEFVSGLSDEQAQKAFNTFNSLANNTFSDLQSKLKDLEKYEHFPFKTDPNKKTDQKLLNQYVEMLMTYVKTEEEAYKQGKLTKEQEAEYKKTLEKTKDMLEQAKKKGYEYKDALQEIKVKLDQFDGKTFNVKIKFTTDVSELQSFTNSLKGFKLPSYDVGTNYVQRDQIAMIHEGEAIIPKKYNNSEYLGQMGNSETNALLVELNRSILEFANRPQTLNVNGKELAKVTYGDYQEEGSRRGANTSIRRV